MCIIIGDRILPAFPIFLSTDPTDLVLETTYASDSYYIVTIKRIVENSFWLYRSRCWRPVIGLLIWFEPLIRNQMSISTPAWTPTSFFPSRLVPPLAAARKEKKRNAIRKPDKGGSANFLQNQRDLGRSCAPYLIVKQTSAAENPGCPIYIGIYLYYICVVHISG